MKQLKNNGIKPWITLFTCMAALLLMGGNALALVDLDASPVVPITFATEIDTSSPVNLYHGVMATDTTLNVTVDLGDVTNMVDGEDAWIRFDLPAGVTFYGTPTLTVDTGTGNEQTGRYILNGGGHGATYIVFEITGDLTNFTVNTVVDLGMQMYGYGGGVTVSDENDVTIQYRLYTTSGGDTAAGVAADTDTADYDSGALAYITWDAALAAGATSFTAGTPALIDVAAGSQLFESAAATTAIGRANFTLASGVYWMDGSLIAFSDLFSDAYLVISGDFAAGAAITGFTTVSTSTIRKSILAEGSPYASGDITYDLTGVSTGQRETTLRANFSLTKASGIDAALDLSSYTNSFTLCTLEKNGVTKTVWNLPSPDHATESGYVFITNTSDTAGAVNGRLYYSDGTMPYDEEIVASIPAHGTVVLGGNNWSAVTNFPTTWSGKARLVLDSALSSMEVYNYVVSNGTLLNMSSVVKDGDE